jgi:uncharacterized protein
MYKCTFYDSKDVLSYNSKSNLLFKNNKLLKVKNAFDEKRLLRKNDYSIRITLGRNCNLRCAYCIQCNSRENPKEELTVNDFFRHLKFFLGKNRIFNVEFWGGEPLLYFEKIKQLHKKFVDELNVSRFWFATNGQYLTDEVTDFIIQNKFFISISYDGPGQELRGYDMEHDKVVMNNIKRLNNHKLLAFLPVMSNLNKSMSKYQEKIKNLLGTDEFVIGNFPLINVVDNNSFNNRVPDDYLSNLSREIYSDFMEGKLSNIHSVQRDVFNFINHFGKREITSYRICLALNPKKLSIDMAGNWIACHNFNKDDVYGNSSLYLGNIKETKLKKKPMMFIPESAKRLKRLNCSCCIVKHICNGGCAFQNPEYEEYNCKANFYYNLAIFKITLSMITGKIVKDIIEE